MTATGDPLAAWRRWHATYYARSIEVDASPVADAPPAGATEPQGDGDVRQRAGALAAFAAEAFAALSDREPDPIEEIERAAHFGAEAAERPYRSSDDDPLRDGLAAGARRTSRGPPDGDP